MSKLRVELPESLRRSIIELANRDGYSVDQFVALAAAEKVAALRTLDYLREQAARADRRAFDRFLAAVPNAPVLDTDRPPGV